MASTTETGTAAQRANSEGFQVEKNLRNRDEFYKETYRFFDALGHHRKWLFVAAALFIGACVAGGILANQHEAKSEAGRDALFLAQKSYETELKALAGVKAPAPDMADKADKDDTKLDAKAKEAAAKAKEAADKAKRAEDEAGSKRMEAIAFSKLDVDAKFGDAVKAYHGVITQFGGTRAALEARMALGTLYFNHGQPALAAPIFKEASETASGNFEKSLAFLSWGYALENDGKPAEAITAYEKALNYGEGGIKGDSLLAIARSHEAMHDVAKARSTYDQIITQLPNSEAAKTAESLKAKL